MASWCRSWRRKFQFDNDGLARDGTEVSWRLKKGVVWHDGKPFTADDVIFTWSMPPTPPPAP